MVGGSAAPSDRKEVRHMRITFHIGDITVTVILKKRNRHSAK